MGEFTTGNAPGHTSLVESAESQVWWSGPDAQHQRAHQKIDLLAANVDSGNTPTTTLRGGNILGINFATRNAYIYDPDSNAGPQVASGVLEKGQSMLVGNTATNRFTAMLVTGLLKRQEIIGLDAQAEAQLIRGGFKFDDAETPGAAFLVHPKAVVNKVANYTVVAADNGKRFVANQGSATNFILPTIAVGLAFDFLQLVDQNMVITGSDNIVHKDNSAADTVTFSTGSEKIGSLLRVTAQYVGTSPVLRWVAENLGGTTAVAAG